MSIRASLLPKLRNQDMGHPPAATTMDNPFGLTSNHQNIDFSGAGNGAAGVGAAVVAEGVTLNNLVNNLGENLAQMYSGLGGISGKSGTWTRPPAYCQSSACPAFGAKIGKDLTKMGGDPRNLKYPQGQVGKTKCQ